LIGANTDVRCVSDHDGLAPFRREFFGDQPRADVGVRAKTQKALMVASKLSQAMDAHRNQPAIAIGCDQ